MDTADRDVLGRMKKKHGKEKEENPLNEISAMHFEKSKIQKISRRKIHLSHNNVS